MECVWELLPMNGRRSPASVEVVVEHIHSQRRSLYALLWSCTREARCDHLGKTLLILCPMCATRGGRIWACPCPRFARSAESIACPLLRLPVDLCQPFVAAVGHPLMTRFLAPPRSTDNTPLSSQEGNEAPSHSCPFCPSCPSSGLCSTF